MKHHYLNQLMLGLFLCLCSCLCFSQNSLPKDYKAILKSVYKQYKTDTAGNNADYIPELAITDPHYFAISIATVEGDIVSIGDANRHFSIQSISKVFAYALALKDNDEHVIFHHIGLDATGEKFNSINPIEKNRPGSLNPYVNAGAIQTTSYIKGKNSEEKWQRFLTFLSSFGHHKLFFSQRIYHSETDTNTRNNAIAHLLKSRDMLKGDPQDVLDRYTKACSVMVTTEELALMGATFANTGINPKTKQPIISPSITRHVLSQMLVNGLYEKSGTWFVNIGVPAKSGVSGGLLAIIPNKMAIAVYSPPLDSTGTSVRGQKVIQALSDHWGLHLLDN